MTSWDPGALVVSLSMRSGYARKVRVAGGASQGPSLEGVGNASRQARVHGIDSAAPDRESVDVGAVFGAGWNGSGRRRLTEGGYGRRGRTMQGRR
jgi:hypothetical protein